MSAPTVTSLATDSITDKAMGWGNQCSGGRGKRGYENQLSRRQQERMKIAEKAEEEKMKNQRKNNATKITDLIKKADAGELDWM